MNIKRVVFRALQLASLAVLPALILAAAHASPALGQPGQPEGIDEISELGAAEIVEPDAVPRSAKPTLKQFAGRLHPAVVHFPIAWLVALCLIELGALLLKRPSWETAGWYALVGTAISIVPGIVTGLIRESSMPQEGAIHELAETHALLIFIMAGLVFAALILRLITRRNRPQWARLVYLMLIASAAALVMAAGHYGGMMVFGPLPLPF